MTANRSVAGLNARFVATPGRRIHVWTAGEGDPALLFHGFTDDGSCWVGTAPLFTAHGYRVIAPDARAHGRTPLLAGDGFTAGDRVQDAVAVMKTLGIRAALAVGHSMGAITAMQLAARHPTLVRAVVLIDPPLTGDESTGNHEPDGPFEVWVAEVASMETKALAALCRRENPAWTIAEVDAWVASKQAVDQGLFRRPQARYDGPWRAAFEAIRCPALVVAGEMHFGSLVDEAAGRWLDELGHIDFVRIDGAGHSVHRDAAAHFAVLVGQFLDDLV